jgi:SAM-dependent methyltransferase
MLAQRFAALLCLLSLASCASPPTNPAAAASARTTEYVRGPATVDGIGKYYMGREISQVMGHLGAGWLERDTRETEERTDLLLDFLAGQGGDLVADIGAGTGYFAFPWADVLDGGRVLAVDIQPEMLAIIRERGAALGVDHVEPVRGTIEDPNLPAGQVDVVLIVDAYHEFSHPREMMAGIVRGLRPGGRLVLVEYRAEDPFVPIKDLHRMSEAQAILEVEQAGLEWVETQGFLPLQHVMVFRKPAETP